MSLYEESWEIEVVELHLNVPWAQRAEKKSLNAGYQNQTLCFKYVVIGSLESASLECRRVQVQQKNYVFADIILFNIDILLKKNYFNVCKMWPQYSPWTLGIFG